MALLYVVLCVAEVQTAEAAMVKAHEPMAAELIVDKVAYIRELLVNGQVPKALPHAVFPLALVSVGDAVDDGYLGAKPFVDFIGPPAGVALDLVSVSSRAVPVH
eukprot:CAMPEP_0170464728 /NCGR_PEP_ID=MMETSP0123-20130129/9339_1 /TAXON_ID=182087 /ORGANISM="Favella ehrenbergii, Strain Fehren 1" /LENGTH=103 /DNA_ID=CAMNT_0010730449 /DNA_START=694 /DNA_END=1005 /DNA_ORIENTATION=+